jgi:hypothetical protein
MVDIVDHMRMDNANIIEEAFVKVNGKWQSRRTTRGWKL